VTFLSITKTILTLALMSQNKGKLYSPKTSIIQSVKEWNIWLKGYQLALSGI